MPFYWKRLLLFITIQFKPPLHNSELNKMNELASGNGIHIKTQYNAFITSLMVISINFTSSQWQKMKYVIYWEWLKRVLLDGMDSRHLLWNRSKRLLSHPLSIYAIFRSRQVSSLMNWKKQTWPPFLNPGTIWFSQTTGLYQYYQFSQNCWKD